MSESEMHRAQALARLDQQDPEMEKRLDDLIAAARLDLGDNDKLRVIAAAATGATDQGIAFAATMFAYAVVRLTRQEPAL